MDRKKLYRQLIDNNPLRAAELTEYKNSVARQTRAKKEAQKKAEAAKREALEAKATPKQETPAVSKWDAPAGSHLSSVANDISAAKVPDYLLRPDDKPQRDQFNKFLAGQRRQMFDTVAKKTNSLMNMYTGIPDEDAKVDAYKRATDLTAMMNPADGEFSYGEDYGNFWSTTGRAQWFKDAIGAIGQKMNEGQIEAAYGQMNRAQEWIDTSDIISEGHQKQQKFDDINAAIRAAEAFYGGAPQWKDVDNYESLENDLNNKINKLRTYYPDITIQNFPDHYQQILKDRGDLASDLLDPNSRYKKAEQTLTQAQAGYNIGGGKHALRQLGVFFHDSKAASQRWTGTTSDYFGDRVDEALDNLAGYQNASPEEQKQMIANFRKALYDVQTFDENQIKIQKQELDEWNKNHPISKEWHERVRRAQQNYERPEGWWNQFKSNWNADNILYNQVEQFGYSASSWDKQAAAMAINMTAMALSGGTSIPAQLTAGTLAATGASIGVSSGHDENDQEVMEGVKTRISNSLQNAGKDVVKDVMEEGKRKWPEASEDEILDKIAHLEFLPNNHKALEAIVNGRKGINATYERDMAAVVSDEAFGAAINGIGALPKAVGAGMSKKLADNAKYRFVRRKANQMMSAAEEAVESSTSKGLGLVGAPFVAAGKAAAKSKAGRWTVEQGTKVGEKIANSKIGKLVSDGATRAVEFGKIVPTKLLAKASPEARYMLEKKAKRMFLGKEVLDQFGRVTRRGGVLSFAGKAVSKGFSESIEEGKQGWNKKDWIENENPEQVVGLFDLLLTDASKGLQLLPSAVGVPFGISLGMSNDPEIFSSMFGGYMGGAVHQASINAGSSILKAVGSGSYWGDQISIGDALAHNAVLDSHDALTRFTKGAELAKRLSGSGKQQVMAELNAYAEFNKKRKEQGLSYVDPDLILEEQDYINKVANAARLQTTKDQAKAAGIKVGSDDYYKFVSASVMYNQLQADAREKLIQAQSPITQIIQRAVADLNSESTLAFLEGEEAPSAHPIVELFRRSSEQNEQQDEKDTANHARRAKNESKADYRKRVAEEKNNDQANEKALRDSVAGEQATQQKESDESIFARGLSALAELAGLTEYLNNLELLDKYEELRKTHDVRWIKSRINKRIGELKAMIDPSKLEEVMANPAAYFEDEETFDQLKDLFQTKMGVQLEYDAARMMSDLLTGVMDPSLDAKTKQLRIGWKLSKASDVIAKLQENVDKNFKLVDEANKEFEARMMPKEAAQPLPETEESKAVDDALAAAEEEILAPEVSPAPTFTTQNTQQETQTVSEPPVNPTENNVIIPQNGVTVQEVNEAIDIIKQALKEANLEDSQASVPASDPRIIQAGIKIMLYNLQKGDYSFDAGIIGTYQTFIDSGMSEASIWQLLPYFPSWYMAAAADPSMNEHYQEFDDIKTVKNTDIEAVIAAYVNANSSAAQQQQSLEQYKQQLKQQHGLEGVFESMDEALNTVFSVRSNKFAVIDPDTKQYSIYEATEFKDGKPTVVKNSDGITVVVDGKQLTPQQIQSLYDEASRQPSPQDDAYKQLQKRIDEDNARVVAVTGHDYFIKDESGKVVMYPRVHTVLGDQYEDSEQHAKDEAAAKNEARRLIDAGDRKALIEFIKSIDGYQLYLDQLDNDPDTKEDVIEALGSLKARKPAGPSVEVGNVADEIVRIFFDTDAQTITPLNYSTLTIKLQGKDFKISQLMDKAVFDELISSLTTLKETYDRLGYRISSKRHRWFAEFATQDGVKRIAGETDLVAIDEQGKFHIIDTKTSKDTFAKEMRPTPSGLQEYSPFTDGHDLFDSRTNEKRKARYSTKIQYSRQLTTYMLIMQKAMPNIVFAENPLELLPIEVGYTFKLVNSLLANGSTLITPITKMFNGLYGQPDRIELDVQQDLINGLFATDNTTNQDVENLKQVIREYYHKVNQAMAEVAEKIEKTKQYPEVSQELSAILGLLNNLKDAIYRDSTVLVNSNDRMTVESLMNNMDYQQKLENYLRMIETAMQKIPTVPQKTPTTDGFGWKEYNTADREQVNQSVAEDGSRLDDVTGNADFDKEAVCEVISAPYVRKNGQIVVPIKITYKGKTYSRIEIQISDNSKGQAMVQQLMDAFAKKGPNDKIVLTGMKRTAGRVKTLPSFVDAIKSPLIAAKSLYDISTEYGKAMFGLAKRDKDSKIVRVLGQGNTPTGQNALYTFPAGRGTEGAVFAIIKPDYDSSTTLVTPLININFSNEDALTFAQLIQQRMLGDQRYRVELGDGTESEIPLTVEDLISMFLPIGQYDGKYNKASYVRFEQNTVIFSTPAGERQFDPSTQASFDAMVDYIKSLRINVDQSIIDSRLGEATTNSHPFGRMANWFNRHPNVNSIRIGTSRFTFDRTDFKNPNDPRDKKGLSGLGWMIKCGVFMSEYGGIHDPRFSFNDVSIIKPEDQTQSETPIPAPKLEQPSGEEETFDESNIIQDYGDDYFNKTQHGKAKNPINKEKVIKRLQRIFGKDIAVEVVENIYDMNGRLIPGVVGRLYSDVIRICERAAEGTEFHEAFHRVSLLLLPKSMQKILYRGIKNAMRKRLGKNVADNATDRQIEEFGANECERFFMGQTVNLTLHHPFEFIRGHYQAYKNVGSLRLYALYMAMNNGLFKNMKTRNTDIPAAYKFQAHGVGFDYVYDDRMYQTLIKSMLYYIMYAQKIRKDGKNINKLNLSKEIFDEPLELKGKDGKLIVGKDGKPFTLRKMLQESCRNEIGKLAAEEAIEKWDTVKMDMIEYIGSFGIDYRESIKNDEIVSTQDAAAIEEEKNALEGEVPNDIGNHTKEAYETSRTAKATTGIRFFTSMIKKYETDANGKQTEARNELGFYEFMDGKEVLVKMFSDLHDVKSPSQMVKRLESLAKTDKTYKAIYEIVQPMYEHQYKKDGTLNPNTEQFVTQLFNLMAAYHMEFKRINATKNRQDKLYTLKVESCGQEYESREYRKSWGMLLTYGGTSLFTRDENGKLALQEQSGSMNAVEKLCACFDKLLEVKQQFSQDNVTKLLNGEEPTLILDGKLINITNEQDLFVLKRKVCDILNYIGIEFSVAEFDYMLNHKYGNTSYFDQLNSFFNESGFANISNLWSGDFKMVVKDPKTGKWNWNVYSDNTLRHGDKVIDVENVYVNNSFCSELSKYKYMYNHETTDMQVLVSKGNTYYCMSENNYISDVTDELSIGGPIVEMLGKYCYNYVESIGQAEDGSTNVSSIGSIILKAAKNLRKGEKLPIKVCTLVQFKTNEYGDDGSGYFDISEREDYTAKASILESGGIIFPTMSDKKTWVYIEGIQLPGIEYGQDESNNFEEVVMSVDEDEVLEQMLEYISTEAFSIEQTIKQLDNDEISDDKKVVNYHKGKKTATVVDKNGVSHKIAQGTVFSSFVGMWDEDGKYISFNRVLDDEGNFIDPRQNLQKAKDLFFSKSHDEQKRVVAIILDHQTEQELLHLEGLGLVKRNANNNQLFENVGLNDDAIKKIAKFIIKSNVKSSNREPNFVELAQATKLYVRDIVSKSIMSIQEIERVYSGNPAFYKFEFNDKGYLVDRSTDEFKRLGGLISTGMNNNTEIKGAPEDGMYVCAQVNNDEVSSTQIDKITEMMSICEWRQAARQCLTEPGETPSKAICDKVNSLDIEQLKEIVKRYNPDVYQIVEKKIKKETSSYAKGIDVADGGAYISPQMTEWLLRMCGEYDARVQKAFEILKNPKADVYKQEEAYRLVTTKVIGAQKYTAFGMRLSEDGTTTYPYYNKMALFPVFKCIATGKFAKLYDQMEKQGVHMLMIDSAVKLGSQGSIDYSTDDNFKFNTYKQQFKYLRKQFNTNPHHKDEQSMGTQMVKVALSSLVMGNTYTKEDGTKITGRELLDQMMGQIRELSKLGKEKVDERFYTDGKIDQEKLGKFLREQLTSRDSDKSIIDAISIVKTTIADKVISSLKFPLSAISRINWLQSILVSFINDKVVDVNTQGNAFYQRSVWNMEGNASEFIDDENLPENLNGGKDLQMIIEDDPAKGAMDCILTMDYFADVLKKAGLQKASFEVQKKALMDAGIIGPNAKACFVGYRIPTQAQSSIHPLRCVDVLPVIQHNIILPREFTKITGSDFDIDKIYIGSLNFNLKKSGDSWINDESEFTREQNLQNELIRNYVSILRDDNGVHIAHRSIDNDTDLLKDVLADIEEGRESKSEVMPYDFYCLRTHTRSKNDFLTGKTGIGPFALNNNSQVLTMLYGVTFKENSLMDLLGHGSLANPTDDDGQSILSWISALINAHVDIAKDPYISRLNVNQMTYNLTNLLIRTGYGKNTFYFLTQPVMLKMAEKYRQAQGKFMQEEGKSSYQIMKEAKDAAALEFCGKDAIEQAKKLLYTEEKGKVTRSDRFVEICTAILENKDGRLRGYSKGKYDANKVSDKVFQALVYLVDKELERPAQQISNLVQYSKIDTKKQGKSVSEQLAYVKGIIDTFGDAELAHDMLGYPMPNTYEDYENMYTGDFEFDSIQRMYWDSFIGQKTHDAIRTFLNIMDGQVFEATSGFRAVVNNIADMLGKKDATSIQKISDAVAAKIKADAINKYAEENEIDIPSLVTGTNTIYDRLNRFKCLIHTDPRYSYLLDGNGEIRNPLLKLLISDKSWIYNHSLHLDSAEDKFGNLKFIRLFDALDLSSSKTDYVIQAWDDLLNDASHPEVQKFARDLCVYAFVTSGDQGGRTKLFQYVPNSFREESGYVDHIRQVLAELKDNDAPIHMMQAAFIDDVILNNADDFTFVPRVDISNKNWKEGDTKWTSVTYPNLISYLDKDGNNLQKQYAAKFPILVSVDPSTPIDAEDVKPFIKVKRSNDDGSQRSYTVLKLVGICQSEKQGKVIPVYAKVNQRGYHIDGYDFYEYGSARVYDQEYYPSIDLVKQSLGATRENVERFEATYGKQYTTIVDALNNSSPLGPEYDPYDRWIGAPKQAKTYKPLNNNPGAPSDDISQYGKLSGLIEGEFYDADQIHEAYKNMPEYEQYKELAEMVFATAKQFNIKFEAVNEPEDYRAGTNMKGDHVQYNIAKLKSSTLLHEAIHVCTSYWIEQYDDAPQNVKEAFQELKVCYKIVKEEYAKSGEELPYGLTQFKEFVAELSNPSLVEIIKKVDANLEEQGRKQSVIDRIVSAIFTLFNINKQYDSIESTAKNALKQLITTVDKDLYGQHYEKYERLRDSEDADDNDNVGEEQLKKAQENVENGTYTDDDLITILRSKNVVHGKTPIANKGVWNERASRYEYSEVFDNSRAESRISDVLHNIGIFDRIVKVDAITAKVTLIENKFQFKELNSLLSGLYDAGKEMLETKCTR